LTADDGAYVETMLRARGAAGRNWLSTDEARHYREALLAWPSPHCALEYQRMFVRDQLRPAGRDYRRALRGGTDVPLLSVHGQEDRVLPIEAVIAAQRWARGRHEVISLPGVGHLPHEEDPDACNDALLRWLLTLD
jgi:pimeloyl-ACP methyl ester carboxylesterase